MQETTSNGARNPRIGEVYFVKFEGHGNEQQGWRPAVIFQNNVGNAHSPNVIVLPMTSSLKRRDMPTHVVVDASCGLRCDSMVLCENPKCVSKELLGSYVTTLPADAMREIALAHLQATAAISFLDVASLVAVWQQANRLNQVA